MNSIAEGFEGRAFTIGQNESKLFRESDVAALLIHTRRLEAILRSVYGTAKSYVSNDCASEIRRKIPEAFR